MEARAEQVADLCLLFGLQPSEAKGLTATEIQALYRRGRHHKIIK